MSYLGYRIHLKNVLPRLCKLGRSLINFDIAHGFKDFSDEKVNGRWHHNTYRRFYFDHYDITMKSIQGRTNQNQFKNASVEFVFIHGGFETELEVMLQ